MRLHIDPPLLQWSPRRAEVDRGALIDLINRNSVRGLGHSLLAGSGDGIGGGDRASDAVCIIATGHQPALWHPGILAKYAAVQTAANARGTGAFHLVVDHDAHDALALSLPVSHDNRLSTHEITWPLETTPQFGATAGIPTGATPPVSAAAVVEALRSARDTLGDALTVDLQRLIDAWCDLPPCNTLAEQVTRLLARLWKPYVGDLPVLFVSQLIELPTFAALAASMRDDARACAAAFNGAVAQHPHAGIAPLTVESDRVELPLWLMRMGEPRKRIWSDVSGTRSLCISDRGEEIDMSALDRGRIVPRAVTLSAFIRDWACDLFVRGLGGEVYDAVTEAWWQSWRGRHLPAAATVSADVTLPFDAPIADQADLHRAQWWLHHLPHNVDRHVGPSTADCSLVARKHELLAHMNDDRDRRRRAVAFGEVCSINDKLASRHPALLTEARHQLDRARAGVANRAIAARRDWCFALYPPDRLEKLAAAIRNAASATDTMPA